MRIYKTKSNLANIQHFIGLHSDHVITSDFTIQIYAHLKCVS